MLINKEPEIKNSAPVQLPTVKQKADLLPNANKNKTPKVQEQIRVPKEQDVPITREKQLLDKLPQENLLPRSSKNKAAHEEEQISKSKPLSKASTEEHNLIPPLNDHFESTVNKEASHSRFQGLTDANIEHLANILYKHFKSHVSFLFFCVILQLLDCIRRMPDK